MVTLQKPRFIERTNCIACGSPQLVKLSTGRYSENPLHDFMLADPGGERVLRHLGSSEWAIVRCNKCAQVFHKYILDAEWNERRFSEWMDADTVMEFERRLEVGEAPGATTFQHATAYVEHIVRLERLTRRLRGNERLRLLDFGCGWGGFIAMCQEFGFEAVGVDRSHARSNKSRVPIHESLDKLGTGRPFHVLTLFEVLEHLDEPLQTLQAAARHLQTNGVLILETPDCSGVEDIQSKASYYKVHPLDHINAFTPSTLQALAQRACFKPLVRGPAFVSGDAMRVVKRSMKHLLRRDGRSTQQYFLKVS